MPDLRALRVAQTTSQLLQAGHLKRQPAWLPTVTRIPSTTDLTRTPPPKELDSSPHRRSRRGGSGHKVRRLFEPQPITYPEDSYRARFYKEHPWELARPTLLVENDEVGWNKADWSRMQQPGRRVSGESVVQRQLYLISQGTSEEAAYLQSLDEFYAIRMREAVEARVAMEEALAYGTKFNKTQTEVALDLESQVLEKWREKAIYAHGLRASNVASTSSINGNTQHVSRRDRKKKSATDRDDSDVPGEEDDVLDDLLN